MFFIILPRKMESFIYALTFFLVAFFLTAFLAPSRFAFLAALFSCVSFFRFSSLVSLIFAASASSAVVFLHRLNSVRMHFSGIFFSPSLTWRLNISISSALSPCWMTWVPLAVLVWLSKISTSWDSFTDSLLPRDTKNSDRWNSSVSPVTTKQSLLAYLQNYNITCLFIVNSFTWTLKEI